MQLCVTCVVVLALVVIDSINTLIIWTLFSTGLEDQEVKLRVGGLSREK